MDYLRAKNFDQFQHYKDRNPPWIKLYTTTADDYLFSSLPDATKAHLILIWLLASKTGNKLPNDPRWIQQRIGASEKVRLDLLIQNGFLIPFENGADCKHDASKALATRKQVAPDTGKDHLAHCKQNAPDPSEEALADCKHDASPRALARGEQSRDRAEQSRGDPYRPPLRKMTTGRKVGCQIPPDFTLTEDRRAYFIENGHGDPDLEFEQFRDHALKTGAVYRDWEAAWRTWTRNSLKYNQTGGRHVGTTRKGRTFREIDAENEERNRRDYLIASGLIPQQPYLDADLPSLPDPRKKNALGG